MSAPLGTQEDSTSTKDRALERPLSSHQGLVQLSSVGVLPRSPGTAGKGTEQWKLGSKHPASDPSLVQAEACCWVLGRFQGRGRDRWGHGLNLEDRK